MEERILTQAQRLAALRENFPESARVYDLYDRVVKVLASIEQEGGLSSLLEDAKSALFDEIGDLFLAAMLKELG